MSSSVIGSRDCHAGAGNAATLNTEEARHWAVDYAFTLRARIKTWISSLRLFSNASRWRPSGSCVIVDGIELATTVHPAGNTTLYLGRPKARSHTSSSPSRK